jgi:hypothetical protein
MFQLLANDVIMYWPFHGLDHIHNKEDQIYSQKISHVFLLFQICLDPNNVFCSQAFLLYSGLSIKFLHGGNLAICGRGGGEIIPKNVVQK